MTTADDFFIDGPAGRLSVRAKGLNAKPAEVVVLVQGANLSGQTGFDFGFEGGQDYSTMDALVAAGFGAVTFAIRGYAQSDAPADPLAVDTDAAIEDLAAVIAWTRGQGFARVHLLGWSWGGRIVGRYTEQHSDGVDRLVLLDPALGGGAIIPFDPPEPWWTNTREDFLKRVVPEFSEADGHAAFADHVVGYDPRSPNGIRAENARGSVPVDPAKITRPTLMIYGSAAARQAYMQGTAARGATFEALATKDRALVIVPDSGDYGHLERPRRRFHAAIVAFLQARDTMAFETEADACADVAIRADYATISTGQVHRLTSLTGAAGPPLYALHATAYSGRTFAPLMRCLAGRRVVALDAPGYGASDRPPHPWPLERYADALAETIDAAGDGPVDLLGYHTGALFAVALAARRPELVRRLVLIGVPYFPPGPEREERRATLAHPMRLTEDLHQFDERWAFFVRDRKPGVTLPQGFANFVDELRAWPYGFWAHEAAFTWEPGAAMAQVTQPVLVLNPINHLSEASRQAAALMPSARVEDVPDLQDAVLDVGAAVLAPRIEAFLR